MGARRSQPCTSLAEEIRNLPSQAPSPANVLFRESIQCKQRVLAATFLVVAIHDSSRKDPEERSGALPLLAAMQPPLL